MKEYDDYKVSVNGYTDNTGKPELNQTLSEQRAKVCADYLISKGIDASRVSSAGFGSSNPIADNKTPAGRALNRRTEFKLTLK
jgi:outer membrane protein OmpA-like peptidoglycan-associated protein